MSALGAVATRERPILMSGPMVRAVLDGRKTQTRRVVKRRRFDADGSEGDGRGEWCVTQPTHGWTPDLIARDYPCPYGVTGDRLWVRETWAAEPQFDHLSPADIPMTAQCAGRVLYDSAIVRGFHRPRPSIHMPRWASRLTLEITGVRVERVQAITEADAKAEGVEHYAAAHLSRDHGLSAVEQFAYLWDSLNAPRGYSFGSDPWVWVLEFRRIPA